MVITTLEGYALRALVYIALKDSKKASVREIAMENGISFSYTLRICSTLREKGILESDKGRNGGYLLKRDPATISLLEVVKAVGKDSIEIKCDFGKNKTALCYTKNCALIPEWKTVKIKFDVLMNSVKLKDFIQGGSYGNSTNKSY
jgi:Rrf2 family protein